MPTIYLRGRFEWREEEPDGRECSGCGHRIYLRQYRPFFSVRKYLRPTGLNLWLCQSCYEVLSNDDDDEEEAW